MKVNSTGKLIRELRIRAGYTQKTLSDALHVTDKAISKWERDICLPDVTILPKLALLLDIDVDLLISKSAEQEEWTGLIDIHGCDFSQSVFDKPLANYLLMHFLLVGITSIHVLSEKTNLVYLKEHYTYLGFSFHGGIPKQERLMIINHPWFLFGSDLTQQFQGAMISGRNTKLVPDNQEPVVFFSQKGHTYFEGRELFVRTAAVRKLGRGMICFDMDKPNQVLNVEAFVQSYQDNSKLFIGDLDEIAVRRAETVNQKSIVQKRERNL